MCRINGDRLMDDIAVPLIYIWGRVATNINRKGTAVAAGSTKAVEIFAGDLQIGAGRVDCKRPDALTSEKMDRLAYTGRLRRPRRPRRRARPPLEPGAIDGVAARIDSRSLSRPRSRRVQGVHGTGDQRARCWRRRHGARRLPRGQGARRRRDHPRNRPQSEIAYTDQRPAEYVAVMIAAALREGFPGPLFIQGDHCQVNAKKYEANADGRSHRRLKEPDRRRDRRRASSTSTLIDTSTLVDLSFPTLAARSRRAQLRTRRGDLPNSSASASPTASRSRWARRSAKSATRIPPSRSCTRSWMATTPRCTATAT